MPSTLSRLSSLVLVCLVFSCAHASALEPKSGVRMGGALTAGLPLNVAGGGARGSVNPEQLGFQLSLGYSARGGFYIGGSIAPFLGQSLGGEKAMVQQFTLDLGVAIPIDTHLAVRPMLTFGFQRLGEQHANGTRESDAGILLAPGLDLVADVLPHFWLGGGVRIAFAFMGAGVGDLSWSSSGHDVALQFLLSSGLRF